jgi:opacity protein-like surface antigen
MHKQLQRMAMLTTLAIGASALIVTPALAAPTAQDQDHHDQSQNQKERTAHSQYANNQYYQLGNKEGYEDHKKNLQRSTHNHSYKSDDDRKAHDYGYQQGWHGQDYHPEHSDPH